MVFNSVSETQTPPITPPPSPQPARVPLDFKSVLTVPDSHEWTEPTEHPVVDPHTFESLPLIDLSDPNAMSLIRDACEKWGALQVINHGFPLNLLKEVELQARQLFSLPIERKRCALKSLGEINGYGIPRISSGFKKLLWFEGFTMMMGTLEKATQLWPDQPDQLTSFCAAMEEWQKEMKTLSEKTMELMLGSLGLTPEDVEWFKPKTGCDKTQYVLQLNSYPACPDPDRVMGLAGHTDTSLFTILYQTSSNGLQIFRDAIGWIPVEAVSGALVINVGDFMRVLFNGRFISPVHRVVVNKTHHRITAAYFYDPPIDVTISPLIKLIDHDHPPLYSPTTWKEHIEEKYANELKKTHLSKLPYQE